MNREAALLRKFPGLGQGHFQLTSPQDHRYNCIAFAAGEVDRWWDASAFASLYWPEGAAREDTLDGWVTAFAALGYHPCESPESEAGMEKVAIYGTRELPLHAARQVPGGRWTSKLGSKEDIEHDLAGLEGEEYGTVLIVVARPIASRTESGR